MPINFKQLFHDINTSLYLDSPTRDYLLRLIHNSEEYQSLLSQPVTLSVFLQENRYDKLRVVYKNNTILILREEDAKLLLNSRLFTRSVVIDFERKIYPTDIEYKPENIHYTITIDNDENYENVRRESLS